MLAKGFGRADAAKALGEVGETLYLALLPLRNTHRY